MTIDVSNNNPRIEYAVADGVVQTVFAVPFDFFEDSDLSIYVDGVLKSEGSDYTITGGDGSTGTVTFVTATPPEVQQVTGASGGSTVVIARHVSLERVTDFVAGQDINRAALNTQLDTIVAQIADLDDKVDRTIHLTDSEVPPSMLLTSDRKGRVLAFDSVTGDVEAGPLSNDIQTIADNISEILAADDEAAAAAASATSAAASASAGASSASAASSSAASASASETAAETAQAAAETAESNAATSEANAATSETNAATSAANSATSESNAASSASSAQASKDAALAALDNFDDRYLGQKAADPTVDNDGDVLVAGALYFNTTDDVMKVYEGAVWVAAYASLSGALLQANNLSDVLDVAASRTNLGLGTAATTASTDYATAAQGGLADSAVQPNDSPTFAGLTTTANVSFGDNDKAIFGAGSDLQIFHSGTASWIRDLGTGGLVIDTDGTTIDIKGSSPTEYMARFIKDGAVSLYYDNAAKLATTSTGIDVTGTVTADGLTVDGQAVIGDGVVGSANLTNLTSGTPPQLIAGWSVPAITWTPSSTTEAVFTRDGNMQIDILAGANNFSNINFSDPDDEDVGQISYDHSTDAMRFRTSGGERLRVTASGNVGIGKTNPSTALDVTGTVTATSFEGDGSNLTGIAAGAGGGGSDEIFWENGQNVTTNYTITNGKNAMSAGPITINSGVTVTVGAGETWTVV